MHLIQAIGMTLRELRHEQKLTLRQVSDRAHVSIGYLSEVERGDKSASGDMIEAIAKGLNISTTELVGEIYEYLKENHG